MPNRCVRCGKIYPNAAPEILTGCSCGSHYFFFFKEDDLRIMEETEALTKTEREEILEDVKDIVGEEPEKPIILSLESIRVKKPGKFEIDLVNLFKGKPVIYKLEDGKYMIDLASTFMLSKHQAEPVRIQAHDEEVLEQVKNEHENGEENKEIQDEEETDKKSQDKEEKINKKEKKVKEEYVNIEKVQKILEKEEKENK
jgi:predicted  nucleic acid-binding Zn-ribbon protein